MAQYRYSAVKFRTALLTAIAITLMITGLTWMITGMISQSGRFLWTLTAGLVFFAMMSAPVLLRYVRREIVVAVRPAGLYDARYSSEIIPWDGIRELVLRRTEDEYMLDVHLWRSQELAQRSGYSPEFTMDLTTLEAGPDRVLRAISQFKEIRASRDLDYA